MSRKVYVLNGPNLNLLGQREPHIYGHTTLDQIRDKCALRCAALGFEMFFGQSNYEGQIVDWLHQARADKAAVVINPAGYSFTSMAILDALKMVEQPIFEVHISNIHRREPIYHHSLMSQAVTGVIAGLGPLGYEVALLAVAEKG